MGTVNGIPVGNHCANERTSKIYKRPLLSKRTDHQIGAFDFDWFLFAFSKSALF